MSSHQKHDPVRALPLLTDAQIECLQLVRRRQTAKQIARALNISHHAVEQRLKSARRKLGVNTTAQAVDMLEAAERDAYGCAVYGPPDIASSGISWAFNDPSPPIGSDGGAEVLAAFSPITGSFSVEPSLFERVTEALLGDATGMSWKHRVVFMAGFALVTIIVVSLMVSFIEGLSRLNQ